jgi:hypothetical protein
MEELALHILDLVQNSIEANATLVEIILREDTQANTLTLEIRDNGRGMDEQQVAQVGDPFFTTRTTRKVGLGIPLLKVAAEQAGGWLEIYSAKGRGTTVRASFSHDHIDRAPIGNMADTLVALFSTHQTLDITYCHELNGESFCLDSRELREICGDSLGHPKIIQWLREYVAEHENQLGGEQ